MAGKRYEEEQKESRRRNREFSLMIHTAAAILNGMDAALLRYLHEQNIRNRDEYPDLVSATEILINSVKEEKDINKLIPMFKVRQGGYPTDIGLVYSALYTLRYSWGFGDPNYVCHRKGCRGCKDHPERYRKPLKGDEKFDLF